MVEGGWVEGGCLCGAVRYRVEGPPLHAGYCHCRMCQRAAGAPVVAWGAWPADRFAWLQGKPGRFASSTFPVWSTRRTLPTGWRSAAEPSRST